MSCKVQRAWIGPHLLRSVAAAALCTVTFGMSAQTGPNDTLAASTMSGRAPLVVTFTGTGSGEYESVLILDFGDGQIDDSLPTVHSFTRTHTYAKDGSYTAELRGGPWGGDRPTVLKTLASITITVR